MKTIIYYVIYNARIRTGYTHTHTLDTFLIERTTYICVTTEYTAGRIMISVHECLSYHRDN